MHFKKFRSLFGAILLFLMGTTFSHAITNGLPSSIPAVVQFLHNGDSFCTGTVVGVKPLAVITAAHCFDYMEELIEDIWIRTGDGKFEAKATRVILPPPLINHPEYHRFVEFFKTIKKEYDYYYDPFSTSTLYFSPEENYSLLYDEDEGFWVDAETEASFIWKEDLRQVILEMEGENVFSQYDSALVLFEGVEYPGQDDIKMLKKELKILPIDRGFYDDFDQEEVLLVGYGRVSKQSNEASQGQLATTNILKTYNEKENGLPVDDFLYLVQGNELDYTSPDQVYQRGHFGGILPGDSGGPAITQKGVAAITSFYVYGAVKQLAAPYPNWPRRELIESKEACYPDELGYVVDNSAHLAVGSRGVRSLLKRAKKLGVHLLFSNKNDHYDLEQLL